MNYYEVPNRRCQNVACRIILFRNVNEFTCNREFDILLSWCSKCRLFPCTCKFLNTKKSPVFHVYNSNSNSNSDPNSNSDSKSNQINKSKTDGNSMLTKSNEHNLTVRSSNISVHPIKFQKKGLHVHLNVQHLVPKSHEIKYILSSNEMDIFGACETFLNDSFCNFKLSFPGFRL